MPLHVDERFEFQIIYLEMMLCVIHENYFIVTLYHLYCLEIKVQLMSKRSLFNTSKMFILDVMLQNNLHKIMVIRTSTYYTSTSTSTSSGTIYLLYSICFKIKIKTKLN